MSTSFKQTAPRPADYVEPASPAFSPLISPVRDAWEIVQKLSADDEQYPEAIDNLEMVLDLPLMIPEGRDSLSAGPGKPCKGKGRSSARGSLRRGVYETIRPEQDCRYVKGKLTGQEVVKLQTHVLSPALGLSTRIGREHRVGIDAPWAPDASTPAYAREAHLAQAENWLRDGGDSVRNPLPQPADDLWTGQADAEEELARGPVRSIAAEDMGKPFPVGVAAGEQVTITDLPQPTKTDPNGALFLKQHAARPTPPVGALHRAEMLYFHHEQRKRTVQQLIAQKGMKRAAAVEVVLRGQEKSWEMLEDEAETARGVLQVHDRLPPPKDWSDGGVWSVDGTLGRWGKGKGKGKKKPAAPKGKGKGRAAPEEQDAVADAPSAAGDATDAAAPGDDVSAQDPSALTTEDVGAEAGRSTAGRPTRTREPTLKRKALEIDWDANPLSTFNEDIDGEADAPAAPPVKRQRRGEASGGADELRGGE